MAPGKPSRGAERRTEYALVGALLAILLLTIAVTALASNRPPPVEPPGKWQIATKGAILLQCPRCGNYTIVQVPKGIQFRIRHVHPLPVAPFLGPDGHAGPK